jgi:hypothetical protein
MSLPLITDPFFYAVSIPAVLLLGISKSGFGAGFGSLAVPMMALAVTVPQAAAILMPVLLVMDLLGMAAFRNDFDRKLLKFLLPFGLLGIVAGALLFKVLEPKVVAGIVGGFTLLFLAQRLMFPPRPDSAPPPRWAGALLTVTSGFTSFIAHAGGPPINAYVIPLKLSPVALHRHHGVFLLLHQHRQMDSLCLAGAAGHTQLRHLAGAAALGAGRRVGRACVLLGASTRCCSTASCLPGCFSRASSCCGMHSAEES